MNRVVVAAVALVLAAVGTAAGVMLGRGSGLGRGPLYWDKSDSLVREGLLSPPGEIDAMTVYGVLKGQKPARVTSLRSLPMPGYATPRVVRSALLTGLGEESIMAGRRITRTSRTKSASVDRCHQVTTSGCSWVSYRRNPVCMSRAA